MNKSRILAIIGTTIVLGIIASGLIFGPFNEILPESWRERLGYLTETINNTPFEIRLIVNFGDFLPLENITLNIPVNETCTAYSVLLVANFTVEMDQFPSGIFIKGINGVNQDSRHYWWYLVDGISGTIASNKYDLRSNEIKEVTWIYKSI
ncbi:MAG: DUF4430 domain-containing protein [Candidatus Thorarchaeota archaeon]